MKERDVEAHLVDRVAQLGGETRKVQWIGRRGAPDRLVMLPDRTMWVELKRPKRGVLSEQQKDEHALMRRYGQAVHVAYTQAEVDQILGL